jgi:hypothetical protein
VKGFVQAGKEEWETTSQETINRSILLQTKEAIDNWIDRMPERIQAVFDTKGSHEKW